MVGLRFSRRTLGWQSCSRRFLSDKFFGFWGSNRSLKRSGSQNMSCRCILRTLRSRLKHCGPDWSGLHQHGDCFLAHQRLAIIDPASADQPLYNEDKSIVITVNREIYNHEELRKRLSNHKFRTGSDCDVIAHLYEEYGENFADMLDGMFFFVLLDTRDNSVIVARDAIGIPSLYIGWSLDGLNLASVWITSELKGLNDDCEHFESFPLDHLYLS